MNNIFEYSLHELETYLVENGYKKFAARQIFEWLYKKKVDSFDLMTNISKNLKEHLKISFYIGDLNVKQRQTSKDGTEKFLFELEDGNIIETVLMRHKYGNSVCVTSQIGCNIGCSFCASGLHKKTRNLKASEIVLQVLEVSKMTDQRVSHVVVMGIGEPFDNYDNTMKFIDIINQPFGLEIGARHITISTSGLVPKILEFSNQEKQVNLAISLHAPNNEIRSRLMKINQTYKVETLIEACKTYIDKTSRRITFEYILLEGINDEIVHANQLSDLIRGMNAYVNLIPYNTVNEFDYKGSSELRSNQFFKQLKKRGINATLRKEQGSDIDAACGQLRSKNM